MSKSAKSVDSMLKAVGRQVRKYRQIGGMTQDDLSKRCGLCHTYLSRLENGMANPTLTALCALAIALEVEALNLVSEQMKKLEMNPNVDSNSGITKTVGRQVRKYRLLAGMTQDTLAQSAGIYRPYLSRVEHGTANPTLSVLESLAANLKVGLRELVCE